MSSIEFASPHFLFGLIIIPLLLVWYIFNCNKQQAFVRFSDTGFFDKLPKSWRTYFRHIVFVLEIAALSLFIIALARPQSSTKNQKINVAESFCSFYRLFNIVMSIGDMISLDIVFGYGIKFIYFFKI